MPTRREIPWACFRDRWSLSDPEFGTDGRRASTPLQALMECAPFEDPDTSVYELLELREVLVDAWDEVLTERERWVLEGRIHRGKSLRSVGAELALSKTHINRLQDNALRKLREHLENHPIVLAHLKGTL